MDTTTSIQKGQVVKSKAGRDKGRVFVIYDIIDDQHVLLCDGDLRKLNCPKRKKIKHLMVYNSVIENFAKMLKSNEKINDAFVRKQLNAFYSEEN
ncbi:KOW domain-containing RNA-binding protein [Sedimentibacter sp. zth1]|uniref:KOW domain-containing RNA-binding protein n=1 Tax=Sedimentibacter sp. zth1 TaxID=2816908 RepID=UPI001A922D11|nr:KOW domain-containing RNA-binding protein [Sedimentibacter sp. zth1]QSX06012.1 KOW domain-containing RNA-binding protein [Sedimentibacter sp. zth1]